MKRVLLTFAIGGGAGAATTGDAAREALMRDGSAALAAIDGQTWTLALLVGLPILVILFRSWIGFLVATVLVAGGSALAAHLYVEKNAPANEVLVAAGVYAVGAFALYHLLVRRVIG